MNLEKPRFVYCDTLDLQYQNTSHQSGVKKVITPQWNQPILVKQIALGLIHAGQTIPEHVHPDMDESFFITQGDGLIFIDGERYTLKPGIFVNVPAGSVHSLTSSQHEPLSFIYHCMELSEQ